jgi:hypothetical protein
METESFIAGIAGFLTTIGLLALCLFLIGIGFFILWTKIWAWLVGMNELIRLVEKNNELLEDIKFSLRSSGTSKLVNPPINESVKNKGDLN